MNLFYPHPKWFRYEAFFSVYRGDRIRARVFGFLTLESKEDQRKKQGHRG